MAIRGAGAHLIPHGMLVWDVTDAAATAYELRHSVTAAVDVPETSRAAR